MKSTLLPWLVIFKCCCYVICCGTHLNIFLTLFDKYVHFYGPLQEPINLTVCKIKGNPLVIKQSLLKTPPLKVSTEKTIKIVWFLRKQSPPSPCTALWDSWEDKDKKWQIYGGPQASVLLQGGRSLSRAATSRKIGFLLFHFSILKPIPNSKSFKQCIRLKLLKFEASYPWETPITPHIRPQSTNSRETLQMERERIESTAFKVNVELLSSHFYCDDKMMIRW